MIFSLLRTDVLFNSVPDFMTSVHTVEQVLNAQLKHCVSKVTVFPRF